MCFAKRSSRVWALPSALELWSRFQDQAWCTFLSKATLINKTHFPLRQSFSRVINVASNTGPWLRISLFNIHLYSTFLSP